MAHRDIHCLPAETLSDIFRSAVAAVTPPFWGSRQSTPTQERQTELELERIANAPLLILSQVCSRWHEMAIDTSTFWSTVEVSSIVGHTPALLERTIALLNARLARTRDTALSVLLWLNRDGLPFHPRIFELLAEHSHRWDSVQVVGSLRGLDTSVLSGKLLRLTSLAIPGDPDTMQPFTIAPRLETLCIASPLLYPHSLNEFLRLEHLRSFECVVVHPMEFEVVRSWMAQPHATGVAELPLTFVIQCQHFLQHYTSLKRMCLPSIAGCISALTVCTTMEKFNVHDMATIVEHIFASVTPRQLRRLAMACSGYPQFALQWPHVEFLGLCERSGLAHSLRTLRIVEVHIAESDLLQVLSLLAALERLEVGDPPEKSGTSERGENFSELKDLITDSLLRAMSQAPGRDCLVPSLSYFACVSRLTFTHGLLVDFAAFRVARLSGSFSSFHLRIRRFPGTAVAVTSAMRTALGDLAADSGKFTYEAGEIYLPMFATEHA
ncbi:F-box domain-containing protein [Mycena sanguinolenta]|uniref:F-box domain-containing protein n=1 Tax=Mycena sanguinolenta TaxID=230812 RepID=A0A8H6YGS5_9AGAR|nr:F-box domain-containing protein [Mycena sanguinolenta]